MQMLNLTHFLSTFIYSMNLITSPRINRIQGDTGPEHVETTEAVSYLTCANPGRLNIFRILWFFPSFIKELAWAVELIVLESHCGIIFLLGESLPKPPFKLRFGKRRLLVPGLNPFKLSCSTATWICAFFTSYIDYWLIMGDKFILLMQILVKRHRVYTPFAFAFPPPFPASSHYILPTLQGEVPAIKTQKFSGKSW